MIRLSILCFSALLLIACKNSTVSDSADSNASDTINVWLAHLQEVDQDLLADETMNPEKGWKAFGEFRNFARKNPSHALAPTYHMKAASIARNIPGKALMAIEEYTVIYTQYPQDSLAPQAQFLVGFTFDQNLNDKERAIKAYTKFIEAWPNHPLAGQAKDLIAILNNDGDALDQVKDWQKKQ